MAAKFHVFQSSFSKEISFSLTANEPGTLKNTNNGALTWKKQLVLQIFLSPLRYTPYCFVFPLLITIAVHLSGSNRSELPQISFSKRDFVRSLVENNVLFSNRACFLFRLEIEVLASFKSEEVLEVGNCVE